jgi:energy-coupling factor transporter ATP-binding protein EcfA2
LWKANHYGTERGENMRLVKFRIQNYKRIEETDWIEIGDVAALVGGNETGKTSVLQALWKLKPGRENITLDAQDEFPRRRYTTDYLQGGLWPVVTAVFDLDPDLREQLVAIDSAFGAYQQVECTSYYDRDPMVAFIPDVEIETVPASTVEKLMKRVTEAILKAQPAEEPPQPTTDESEELDEAEETDGVSETERALQDFQDEVRDFAGRIVQELKDDSASPTPGELLASFRNQLDFHSRHDWQRELWADAADEIEELLNRPDAAARFQEAINLAWESVPVFIYFDEYNLLESEVYIPEALQRIAAGSTDPRVRSQWALFERAGFPIKEISSLAFRPDPSQPVNPEVLEDLFGQIRERAIIASAAGRMITEEFATWWHQNRHEIEFRVDGETFQIWVADDKYPMLVEFEGRSRGFRWFFTFYLVFTVETKYAHKNAVLLLDEPGLHLYPPAQEELLQLFDELAQQNQIIYTTHSPFMLDSHRLERIRVVEEMEDGLVKISAEVGHKRAKTVFPIQVRLLIDGDSAPASAQPDLEE